MASDPFGKFNCTYCFDEISGIRVRCAVCTDFELCLQCFSAGAEIGPHKNDHNYQFVDSGALEVFKSKSGWTAREELCLLNGIQKYGFGSWEDVSNCIETRSADEAREEYYSRYLDGTIGKYTWPAAHESRAKQTDLRVEDPNPIRTTSLPPLDITPEEASQLGYLPHRDDFETEYDNDAETLVSQLNVRTPEEDDLDIALKLVQADMYIQRLRERARRKRVCADYQLIAQFFHSRREKPKYKKTASEEELDERLKFLVQFHTAQEHESFLNSLMRQRELQQRLTELLKYRKNGLTRLEELPHFEQELASRNSTDDSRSLLSPLNNNYNDKKKVKEVHSGLTKDQSKDSPRPTVDIENSERRGDTDASCPRSSISPTENPTCSPEREQQHVWRPARQPPLPLSEPIHLLSRKETQLCSSLSITPSKFISLKTLFLAEPPKEEVESDIEKEILNHIKSSGWLFS